MIYNFYSNLCKATYEKVKKTNLQLTLILINFLFRSIKNVGRPSSSVARWLVLRRLLDLPHPAAAALEAGSGGLVRLGLPDPRRGEWEGGRVAEEATVRATRSCWAKGRYRDAHIKRYQ